MRGRTKTRRPRSKQTPGRPPSSPRPPPKRSSTTRPRRGATGGGSTTTRTTAGRMLPSGTTRTTERSRCWIAAGPSCSLTHLPLHTHPASARHYQHQRHPRLPGAIPAAPGSRRRRTPSPRGHRVWVNLLDFPLRFNSLAKLLENGQRERERACDANKATQGEERVGGCRARLNGSGPDLPSGAHPPVKEAWMIDLPLGTMYCGTLNCPAFNTTPSKFRRF